MRVTGNVKSLVLLGALRGFITSIQVDVRPFSLGCMETVMPPAHAWLRQHDLAQSPDKVAEMLWAWIHNADDANKHFVLKSSS